MVQVAVVKVGAHQPLIDRERGVTARTDELGATSGDDDLAGDVDGLEAQLLGLHGQVAGVGRRLSCTKFLQTINKHICIFYP